MAAFFKIPVSAGAVVRAEHVFAVRAGAARTPRLDCRWARDAEGRLIRAWGADPDLVPCEADEPLPFAVAA